MYPAVKEVVPLENYQLLLTFENGEKREFDVKPYLNLDSFKKLKNKLVFNTVHVSFDTIEWQDEIDIDPEILYMDSVEIAK